MLARTLHMLWLLVVAALFLVALVLMAGRLWVPALGEYRAEVETLASQVLERKVSIGRMEGTWRRLSPVLKLKNVVISNPDDPQGRLQIGEIWVGLDVRNYLIEGQVRIASIDVIGAEATLIRDVDGQVYIENLGREFGNIADTPGLPDIDRLSLHDSLISYEDRQAERLPIRFTDVTFTLDITDRRHTLTGYALLPASLGYRVDLSADITGSFARLDQWSGRFYVEGQSLAISPENLRALAADVDVAGVADVRCWLEMKDSRLHSVTAELEIDGLQLHQSGTAAGTDYSVDGVAARFGWRGYASGWQFAAEDIRVGQGASIRRGAGLWLAARRSGEATYYSGNLNRLYLQDLQSVVRSIPAIPEQRRQQLARLQPEGLVEQLYVKLSAVAGRIELLDINASFRDLGVRPSDTAQIRGLSGAVAGTASAGAIWLHSRQAVYRDTGLFRDVLRFTELSGEAGWQYDTAGTLMLATDELVLVNGDFDLLGRLALELPAGGGAPRLDLRLDIRRGELDRVSRYLPARIMPETGVAWLDRSLVSGDISNGSLRLSGPLDKLPFDRGEGRLEVRLPVSNAVLDYNPQWTPIKQLDAQVNFTGRRMEIESRRGRIRSASLVHVNARIDDLAQPDLRLTGSIRGELPVMLAELGGSPLGELYGGFVDRVTAAGAAQLDLEVFVPLHNEDQDIDVKGNIRLADNRLAFGQDGIGFEAISGELVFDNNGISGKDLQARLLDAPVRVDVWTDPGAGTTNIGIQGPLDFVSLATQHQASLDGLLSGQANWSLRLGIGRLTSRSATPDVELELASTLQGISVDLPAPYGKPAAAVQPLSVRVEQVVHPDHRLHLRYGDNLRGIFSLRDKDGAIELLRGGLVAGGGEVEMPDRRELSVIGRLDSFTLDEWQPVLAGFAGDVPGRRPPLRLDLAVGTLNLHQYILEDVAVRMIESGQVRYVRLQGPMVSGSVQFFDGPAGMERVSAELDTLRLRKQESAAAAALSVDPAEVPELDLSIQKLHVQGIAIGRVELRTVTRPAGLQVEHFTTDSDMLAISATGNWRRTAGGQVSDFDIRIRDGKLETLLQEFDYQEEVSGGKLSGSLRASWPGAPWEFQPERLEGKLHLAIEKGRLLNVKPGAGRVFGLVSLHTIPRRLSLDFSDLFKKGFAFDKIEGSFVLNDGDAYTNDLFIEGPAARIDISGRIGLADKDYDELVTVVPHVGSSLPIAGAIAGGPVVGAALLVAEHLLGDELEKRTKFTHRQYTVTGPWSDPVYTPVAGGSEPAEIVGAPRKVEDFE